MLNFIVMIVCSGVLGCAIPGLFPALEGQALSLSLCFFFLFTGLKAVIAAEVNNA